MWWEAEYADLRLDGLLGNAIHPWGLLGAPVTATVRDPEETPYLTGSPDLLLAKVLAESWVHGVVVPVTRTAPEVRGGLGRCGWGHFLVISRCCCLVTRPATATRNWCLPTREVCT
ncbi:hypothetical protein GCM10029976_078060 [Kribbella albertanoniae]